MSEDPIMPRTKDISDDEILALFDEDDAPYMSAGELAETAGMSRQGMHDRLLDLYESGRVDRKKTGRSVGWWVA